eukprot:TRINITY_DN51422_c0_g1_i1.p1 TRINITY_DN51422_c0_g1~~TRINITY_DN51422_c0_g1_i1.p1  ORF type:complete len:890 (+),score=91.82 TRINITY_DN51422_c0_g1_i1:186-2672(+)
MLMSSGNNIPQSVTPLAAEGDDSTTVVVRGQTALFASWLGCVVRLLLFLYSLHPFWQSVTTRSRSAEADDVAKLSCSPGRHRLCCLGYHILRRPGFLVLFNLPLGYPILPLCEFALTVRAFFAMLLVVLLGPQPAQASHQACGDDMTGADKADTSEGSVFDIVVAMRLCDIVQATYMQALAAPNKFAVAGSYKSKLDGTYRRQDCTGRVHGAPVFLREEPTPAYLCRTEQGEWQISAEISSGVRWAFTEALEEDLTPDRLTKPWLEWQDSGFEEAQSLCIQLFPEDVESMAAFTRQGICETSGLKWLVHEEKGSLADIRKATAARLQAAEADVASSSRPGGETSLVVSICGSGLGSLQELCEGTRSVSQLWAPATSSASDEIPVQEYASLRGDAASTGRGRTSCWQRLTRARPGHTLVPLHLESHLRALPPSSAARQASESAYSVASSQAAGQDLGGTSLPPTEHVHCAVAEAFAALREAVMGALLERMEEWHGRGTGSVNVFFTGHGAGAAVACLAALDFYSRGRPLSSQSQYCEEEMSNGQQTVVFGCPKWANARLCGLYEQLLPKSLRCVASRDPAGETSVVGGLDHAGLEVWIDDAGGLTFGMGAGMKEVLPPRCNRLDHSLPAYYGVLNKAFRRVHHTDFLSAWSFEEDIHSALYGTKVARPFEGTVAVTGISGRVQQHWLRCRRGLQDWIGQVSSAVAARRAALDVQWSRFGEAWNVACDRLVEVWSNVSRPFRRALSCRPRLRCRRAEATDEAANADVRRSQGLSIVNRGLSSVAVATSSAVSSLAERVGQLSRRRRGAAGEQADSSSGGRGAIEPSHEAV